MSDKKQNKSRVEVTIEQKLEYAKLMKVILLKSFVRHLNCLKVVIIISRRD